MRKTVIKYKGELIEVEEFETTLNPNASIRTQLRQAAALCQEEEDTKSGKRPIKPLDGEIINIL